MEQQSSNRGIRVFQLLKYLVKKWKLLSSILHLKSKSVGEHQEVITTSVDTQLPEETTTSVDAELIPEDIILEILSRLPVKSILKMGSVSKLWLSLISEPSFYKFQFTQATAARRTALLISAYDTTTRKRYLLSAPNDGGPVTHLMTPDARTITSNETTEVEYLNGLVLFSSGNGFIMHNFAFILNPSTHKIFKLPGPASEPDCLSYGDGHICYFFGFDETRNEHKVLTIRMFVDVNDLDQRWIYSFTPKSIEIMLFSLSNLSWRKIDQDLPSNIIRDWNVGTKHSVCVNSVIHLILQNRNKILVFDLRTEKFSIINLPVDAIRDASYRDTCKKGFNTIISNQPFLMKINGYLGVMCRNPVAGRDEMDIWILLNYEYRLWLKESVWFLKSWFLVDGPFALNPFIRNNIRVTNRGSMRVRMFNVPMYDMESRRPKAVEFELGYPFLHPGTVRFDHVRSYIESMFPLPSN
ncbi:putative F-box domain, galactose oxidase/kelch, beta-propeller, F-box associated interaction [Helianthus debilis subsp. tardiflorus]